MAGQNAQVEVRDVVHVVQGALMRRGVGTEKGVVVSRERRR